MLEEYHAQFFTATINEWKPVLKKAKINDIIIDSLRFLVKVNSVSLFASIEQRQQVTTPVEGGLFRFIFMLTKRIFIRSYCYLIIY